MTNAGIIPGVLLYSNKLFDIFRHDVLNDQREDYEHDRETSD